MRALSAAAQSALFGHKEYFALLEIDLPEPLLRTTNPYSIELEGKVYSSGSGIVEYEPPVSSSVVDSESYQITFSDQDGALLRRFLNKPYGVSARLLVGFYGDDDLPISDSASDYLNFYTGQVDAFSAELDDGARVLKVVMTSPFSDLSYINSRYTSTDSSAQFDDEDTAFDFVSDTGEDIDLEWGKA